MSYFTVGISPLCYMSNEMPGWYQVSRGNFRDIAQMNLGSLVLGSYNTWSYNNQTYNIQNSCHLAVLSAWQNLVGGFYGMIASAGPYMSALFTGGAAAPQQTYTTGNFGTTIQSVSNNGNGDGKVDGNGNGNGNNDALKAAEERAKKAEEKAAAAEKAAAELKEKLEKNQGKTGGN